MKETERLKHQFYVMLHKICSETSSGLIKIIIILSGTYMLTACSLSSRVWAIGAHSIEGHANQSKTLENGESLVRLSEAELVSGGDTQPLQSLNKMVKQNRFDYEVITVKININDIVWDDEKNGTISIVIDGDLKEFQVNKSSNSLKLVHYYRDWYSYPAQTLLVPAYISDVTSSLVIVTLYIIAT